MTFDMILFHAHSGVRWLVVLATVLALGWLVLGLVQKNAYSGTINRIMRIFSISIAAQWALGIVLLVARGSAVGDFGVRYWWEHAFVMTVALVVAHVHYMIKKRPDQARYIGGLISVVVTLALVYVGVALLPQGWGIG